MNRRLLRILDVLIVIAFVFLLYIVIEPQFRQGKINTNRIKLQSNMFTVKAGLERYIAFHEGTYPSNIQRIYDNLKGIELPENPYTGEKMDISEFVQFKYDIPSEVEDDAVNGINGTQRGKPGQIGIGFFIPMGKDSIPTKFGIIGFDENGKPYTLKEGEKERVVVLSG